MVTTQDLDNIAKFDIHSHIGDDGRNPISSDINEYLKNAKKRNVERAFLISTVNPTYETKDGSWYTPLNFDGSGEKLELFSELKTLEGRIIKGKVPKNPFKESNRLFEQRLQEASKVTDIKLDYIPILHPMFDTPEYVESIVEKNPFAVKLKGATGGYTPFDVPNWFWDILKKYDVSAIVHTDYSINPQNAEHRIFGAQNPMDWVSVLEKHDVKASLAHGLRLDENAWKRVKKSKGQFLVTADIKLNTDGYRVAKRGGDYMTDLLSMADPEMLAFGIDYAWHEGNWNLYHDILGKMDPKCFEAFFRTNAEKFYGIQSGGNS